MDRWHLIVYPTLLRTLRQNKNSFSTNTNQNSEKHNPKGAGPTCSHNRVARCSNSVRPRCCSLKASKQHRQPTPIPNPPHHAHHRPAPAEQGGSLRHGDKPTADHHGEDRQPRARLLTARANTHTNSNSYTHFRIPCQEKGTPKKRHRAT